MNRRDRQAFAALGRGSAFGGKLDPTDKDALMAFVRRPEVMKLIQDLIAALEEWRARHPNEVPRWRPLGRVMVSGDLGNRTVQTHLAANESAHAALTYADQKTGNQATLMLAEFALVGLGWANRFP